MPLTDTFNRSHSAQKINESVVQVSNGVFNYYYDFTLRVVTTGNGANTPFSQMDRDTLIMVRDQLVALGGKPPELPPEAPVNQAPARKFNL